MESRERFKVEEFGGEYCDFEQSSIVTDAFELLNPEDFPKEPRKIVEEFNRRAEIGNRRFLGYDGLEITARNTQLEDNQAAMENAGKEAESANAAKTSFLFNMSHDIRTPMNAMTANAFDEDRKNAFAVGMNGHLAKPIEIPKLMESLASIMK